MNTKTIVGGLLVLVVVFLGVNYPKSAKTLAVDEVVKQAVEELKNFGANPGPDQDGPCVSVAGVTRCTYKQSFNNASTTVCAIKPAATSSLVSYHVAVTTGTSTQTIWESGKAVNYGATTTLIGQTRTLAAGAIDSWMGSTTGALEGADLEFTPVDFFNVKYGGPSGATNVLRGTCNAVFERY